MLLGNLLLKRFPRIYTSRNGVLVALLYNLGTMAPPDIIGYKKLRARYGLSLLVCDQSSPIVTPPPQTLQSITNVFGALSLPELEKKTYW